MADNIKAVSIGEMVVSNDKNDVLIAYGLGSCVAVCLYDPTAGIGGMLHALLPIAPNGNINENTPAKFVDQGVDLLIDSLLKRGANRTRLVAQFCGGAQMLAMPGVNNSLNIGQRNVQQVEASLQAAGLRIRAQDTGGHAGRTVKFYLVNGQVTVKTLGQGERILS
ncbi:MAG: chemotaxis protein CheD [Chloroflexota bacterium]